METKVQFQKNAKVLTSTGQRIGSLERIVVNPKSKAMTDIVVRTGGLLDAEEKVVPIGLVTETTESQIVLNEDAGDLDDFPAFEEEHLVEGGENPEQPYITMPATIQPVVFGYPGLGPSIVTTTPGEPLVTEVEQNIPESTVAMKEGAKVISADGDNLGRLERVLAEPALDQITHLLISTGGLARKLKLIPAQWVLTLGEDEVHLRVKKDQVEELTDASIVV